MRRALAAWTAAVVTALAPAAAHAAVSSVLAGRTVSGNAIACTTRTDGVRVCHGTDGGGGTSDLRLKSFDGAPLELYVLLPPAPATGRDGRYPLVIQSHGWGGAAAGPTSDGYFGPTGDAWARRGYAVLQLTARGFHDSCGSAASRLAAPAACAGGYIRLDDVRYEARDAQYAAGLLVDSGLVDPARIGATGPSYGGGVSLELATLKNRVMTPAGLLAPWTSPAGRPLRIAAAAPVIPWSDLTYALMPNVRTLDDQITPSAADLRPLGVAKFSYLNALFGLGATAGHYAPAGSDPAADITGWNSAIMAGEPYDGVARDRQLAAQIERYHGAYHLLEISPHTAPAPLLIANGFTDDLFPVDEALRYGNLERSRFPHDPFGLFVYDGGHPRGQNKHADTALLSSRIAQFFARYVKGGGPQPRLGVTALTQTCPATARSGGPYWAPSWAALHPGHVVYGSHAAQTISSSAGSTAIATALDPVLGKGACAALPAGDQGTGVASYRLPAATGRGYTLLGSPTVAATLKVSGSFAFIAERLWDVNPKTHTETLVARGVFRILGQRGGHVRFQLHPGAWHFAAGHIPKLELLGQDPPYVRTSNGHFSITVNALSLSLPVHERLR